jgi:hypothetical protein
MTREPNPSQIPNPNDQFPQSVGHRQEKANSSLGFGAWSLGFDWDLATWDLVISDSSPPSLSRTPFVHDAPFNNNIFKIRRYTLTVPRTLTLYQPVPT